MFRLKRDPVILANLLAGALMGLLDWLLSFTPEQQGLWNAAIVAVAGLVAAFRVHDGQVVALTAAAKALLAVGLAYGLHIGVDMQVLIMSAVAYAGGLVVRNFVAPIGAPTPAALADPVVEVDNVRGNVTEGIHPRVV